MAVLLFKPLEEIDCFSRWLEVAVIGRQGFVVLLPTEFSVQHPRFEIVSVSTGKVVCRLEAESFLQGFEFSSLPWTFPLIANAFLMRSNLF